MTYCTALLLRRSIELVSYNLFFSDSDNDPWSRNKKKGKKQKKAPKKRQSTQDKLSVLLTQKTTKGT